MPPLRRLFFFNDTATTEIYTLSLHDALPIWHHQLAAQGREDRRDGDRGRHPDRRRHQSRQLRGSDRKSTRLNSSHGYISYAVFCLKKKNRDHPPRPIVI